MENGRPTRVAPRWKGEVAKLLSLLLLVSHRLPLIRGAFLPDKLIRALTARGQQEQVSRRAEFGMNGRAASWLPSSSHLVLRH